MNQAIYETKVISTFIKGESIDVAFISESHDRDNKRLEEHIKLEDHVTISNLYQRNTTEGRPAIIANTTTKKLNKHIENYSMGS